MAGKQEVLSNSQFSSDGGDNDGNGNFEIDGVQELIKFAQEKTYVTIGDILIFFPEAERDVDQLEEAFAALLEVGIPYVDDDMTIEPTTENLLEEIKEKESEGDTGLEESYFANVETDDMVGLYLKEVGRVPLLTAPEEVALAKRIEKGKKSREEMARPSFRDLLDDEKNEHRINIEDGWAARSHIIQANSRLVISVAKKYLGRGVPFEDLIQEGNIGLIRAAKKFDYRRGYKFSTYVTWWIRKSVTRAIADQGRTIRIPVQMGDQINRLLRVQHQLTQRLGRDPTVDELARELDVIPKRVENMIEISKRPISLEAPIDEEEDSILSDFIEDENAVAPDESATHNWLRTDLEKALNSLPPREVRILQLRYGLIDGQTYTLEEVGRKMGVTRERIRQIEAKALRRLRYPVIRRKLRDYLGK